MFSEYVDIFEKYLKKLNLSNEPNNYVFVGASKGDEYYPKKIKKVVKAIGLDEKLTLYTYRHTAITDLADKAGCDPDFLANQAGNTTQIIMKHYLNRKEKHYKNIVENIEKKKNE